MKARPKTVGGANPRVERGPRVLVASLRHLNDHAGWCSNYEFEDVVAAVDDVRLTTLEPGWRFPVRQRLARSIAWRAPSRAFMRVNPGVRPVEVRDDHEVFFFACMNPWDLLYLNAIRGWQRRCRVKVCFMVEFYAGWVKEYAHMLGLLRDFDLIAVPFEGSVEAIGRSTGVATVHVPLACDVARFTPYPRPPVRVVDVYSVGRRSEPVHEVLLGHARATGSYYVHDTLPGPLVRPARPPEHREMYARTAKRSRLFVAYPAKFGDDENRGQSEVGARYFEGAAAGAVLLGQAPTAPAFSEQFPGPNPVIEARSDGAGVAEVVADALSRPEDLARRGKRNALDALRRHDWGHRWRAILRAAALEERAALEARLGALARTADAAESGAGIGGET